MKKKTILLIALVIMVTGAAVWGVSVTGGGQPIINATKLSYIDPKTLRAEGLYREDAGKKLRKSHENPGVRRVYEEYFEQPGSHRAHELLHTHYTKRNKF